MHIVDGWPVLEVWYLHHAVPGNVIDLHATLGLTGCDVSDFACTARVGVVQLLEVVVGAMELELRVSGETQQRTTPGSIQPTASNL